MVQNLCIHYSPALLSEEHPFSQSESIAHYPFPSPQPLQTLKWPYTFVRWGLDIVPTTSQRTANMLVSAHGKSTSNTPYGTVEASELWLKELRQNLQLKHEKILLKFVWWSEERSRIAYC